MDIIQSVVMLLRLNVSFLMCMCACVCWSSRTGTICVSELLFLKNASPVNKSSVQNWKRFLQSISSLQNPRKKSEVYLLAWSAHPILKFKTQTMPASTPSPKTTQTTDQGLCLPPIYHTCIHMCVRVIRSELLTSIRLLDVLAFVNGSKK